MPIAHKIAFTKTAADDLGSIGPGSTGDDLFDAISRIPQREESECPPSPWASAGDETRLFRFGNYWMSFIVEERRGGLKVVLVKRILTREGVKRYTEEQIAAAERRADETEAPG
jgi:hypothetical protein